VKNLSDIQSQVEHRLVPVPLSIPLEGWEDDG